MARFKHMNKTKVGKKLTVNGLTHAQERAILKASTEARAGKNIVGPFTPEEAIKYLKNL